MTSERRPIGLFAVRGPRRPNPIGLHLVRIIEVHDDKFGFGGVDISTRPSGWFDTVDLNGPHTPDSLRANRKD
jgi:hypothetical protein